ncbi:MAG: hypothetical protein PUF49_04345 [Firmicutes bacterium]|nr:hypothetical protein [Bacillota bacterium]
MTEEQRQQYYSEVIPAKRLAVFEAATQGRALDPEEELMQELFCRRHGNVRREKYDKYLQVMFDFMGLSRQKPFLQRAALSKVRKDYEILGFALAQESGGDGMEVLRSEIRNAADRYFNTCRDSDYAKVLGLVKASKAQKMARIREDAAHLISGYKKSCGLDRLPEGSGELAAWSSVFSDAVQASFDAFEKDFMQENGVQEY